MCLPLTARVPETATLQAALQPQSDVAEKIVPKTDARRATDPLCSPEARILFLLTYNQERLH